MNDLGNGIWELAIELAPGNYEYKFSSDGWDLQETLTPGSPCTVTTGEFTNRTLTVTETTTLPTVCWGSCVGCNESSSRTVTFRVDMSDYDGDFTTPEVNGTFNNWCGNCWAMTAVGDDVWEIEGELEDGTYEFKFSHDNWVGQENLSADLSCVIVTGDNNEFVNRLLVISQDTVLPTVCWESCVSCAAASIEENDALSQLSIYPNPSNGMINIVGELNGQQTEIRITDIQGREVYTNTLNASSLNENINLTAVNSGVYFITITNNQVSRYERIIID
jgi:hypothetical protein